jgi:N-methylhydantoinase B
MPMAADTMRRGDVIYHASAGGGGFGSPFEREPERVLEDVLDDKVSREAALEHYGVVLTATTPPEIDHAATGARRKGLSDAA